MVDMYSRLHRYLYAFLLICVSTLSNAVTQQERDMGAFAYTAICSHPTILDYCVDKSQPDSSKLACLLWLPQLDNRYGYSFKSVSSGSCIYTGRSPFTGTVDEQSQPLYTLPGKCPAKDAPPPASVVFSRNGRWFPQELPSSRCFRQCQYSNGQSFAYKHYVFTNGVLTQFTENSASRLKSEALYCINEPEPSRNDQGEITYDAGCEDNMFKVFCDFVEWFRSDSEMPDAPKVESQSLNIAGSLDASHVHIDINNNAECVPPYERDFTITIMDVPYTYHASVDLGPICHYLWSLGNFFRVMYLITAAFIVFRK